VAQILQLKPAVQFTSVHLNIIPKVDDYQSKQSVTFAGVTPCRTPRFLMSPALGKLVEFAPTAGNPMHYQTSEP
jgi:hypothetical protein